MVPLRGPIRRAIAGATLAIAALIAIGAAYHRPARAGAAPRPTRASSSTPPRTACCYAITTSRQECSASASAAAASVNPGKATTRPRANRQHRSEPHRPRLPRQLRRRHNVNLLERSDGNDRRREDGGAGGSGSGEALGAVSRYRAHTRARSISIASNGSAAIRTGPATLVTSRQEPPSRRNTSSVSGCGSRNHRWDTPARA